MIQQIKCLLQFHTWSYYHGNELPEKKCIHCGVEYIYFRNPLNGKYIWERK